MSSANHAESVPQSGEAHTGHSRLNISNQAREKGYGNRQELSTRSPWSREEPRAGCWTLLRWPSSDGIQLRTTQPLGSMSSCPAGMGGGQSCTLQLFLSSVTHASLIPIPRRTYVWPGILCRPLCQGDIRAMACNRERDRHFTPRALSAVAAD